MNASQKRLVPRVGDVIQVALPNGRYAYGRVCQHANVAFYRTQTGEPNKPPIGSRHFSFKVAVFRHIYKDSSVSIVGQDPFKDGENSEPDAKVIRDPLTGQCFIHKNGLSVPATKIQCKGLETAAVWDLPHIVDRLVHGTKSRFLQSLISEDS
jgi:hypothetical protein